MKKLVLAAALTAATSATFAADSLEQQVQDLQAQLDALTTAVENSGNSSKFDKFSFGGYGEHHLNLVESGDNQIDAHRFVGFIGYKYSDKISFFSELELEHSLAGDGKPGEVELEQAFINYKLNPTTDIKAGLFLIPVGILNETHEPDTFYGVERPVFDKRIIPTTWWETGVMVSGQLTDTIQYDAAVHSGLLAYDTDDNALTSIRSGRQKSANATANTPAFTARLRFNPISGLRIGTTINHQTDLAQDLADVNHAATLAEINAVYQLADFTLKADYAHWDIENADNQKGYYIEPSYKLTNALGVFARYSELDYKGEGKEENYIDVGANYWLHKNVVVKADFQKQESNEDLTYNLGLGWSY